MILTIFFEPTDHVIHDTRSVVNGFINNLLGDNNEYHGKFSDYCVSELSGGCFSNENGGFTFNNGCYLTVSSINEDFMETIAGSIIRNHRELSLGGMKVKDATIGEFRVNSNYDIVYSSSPIALKDKNGFITFGHKDFLATLNEKSKKKLAHYGLNEKELKSFKIEMFHPENAKVVVIKEKNGKICIPSSKLMLIVKGSVLARKTLYNLGIGNCTGYGFGSVKIKQQTINK